MYFLLEIKLSTSVAIHVLRLGLRNVRAVSASAIVCKFGQNKRFKSLKKRETV